MPAEPLPKPKVKSIDELDTGAVDPALLLSPADRVVLRRFDEVKKWANALLEGLGQLEQRLLAESPVDSEAIHAIRSMRTEASEIMRGSIPGLLSHSVSKLAEIYTLRERQEDFVRNLADTHGRLEDALQQLQTAHLELGKVAGSFSYRSRVFLGKLKRLMKDPKRLAAVLRWRAEQFLAKRKMVAPGEAPSASSPPLGSPGNKDTRKKKAVKSFSEEHNHHRLQSPYADVDNGNTAMSIFENWVTVFSYQGKRFGSKEPLVSDDLPTITELNEHFPLLGKHVLELGPLEGGNTKQMVDLGAATVTGIESAQESFVKCLLMKNAFQLDAIEFLYGDCNEIMRLPRIGRRSSFDLCVASGLLYHMEDPVLCIDNITKIAPAAYIWSHVASERSPLGPWTEIRDEQGRVYQGRKNEYKETDVLGGIGYAAVWLTPESMKQAFIDRGFAIEDIGEVHNYKGDAVKFIARRVGH